MLSADVQPNEFHGRRRLIRVFGGNLLSLDAPAWAWDKTLADSADAKRGIPLPFTDASVGLTRYSVCNNQMVFAENQ
jgi:hypothetical protein